MRLGWELVAGMTASRLMAALQCTPFCEQELMQRPTIAGQASGVQDLASASGDLGQAAVPHTKAYCTSTHPVCIECSRM
jgi:hypothetical protein